MYNKLIRKYIGDRNTEIIKRCASQIKNKEYSIFKKITVNPEWELVQFSRDKYEVYFGYYDKRQLSIDGKMILAGCVTSKVSQQHEPSAPMEVGYFDTQNGQFVHLENTHAYSWQQGCMLRWLPSSDDKLIAFNDFQQNMFVTVIVDINSKKTVHTAPYATYDISPCGRYAACCDFSRLHNRRLGYGYWQACVNTNKDAPTKATHEIIALYDLKTNEKLRPMELGEIASSIGIEGLANDSYVNHLSFSPNSKKLFFMFFWKEGSTEKSVQLFYNFLTDSIHVLTHNYMSHFCWIDSVTMVAWGKDDHGRVAYYSYNTEDYSQKEYWVNKNNTDGHCTVLPDGSMLTDTYPDPAGFQTLITRTQAGKVMQLCKLYSPVKFAFDLRCDLHPRATAIEDHYTFDSAFHGRRSTYLLAPRATT